MQIQQSDVYARFSAARLSAYEARAQSTGHGFDVAWDLYVWNTRVAGAFMPLLQTAEVVLRNAIAEAFIAVHGARWLAVQGFQRSLPAAYLSEVQTVLGRRRNDVNAAMPDLKFAFWEGLLTARHDQRVWSLHASLSFPGLAVGSRTITHLLDEEFRVGGSPALQRLDRSFVVQCLLRQVMVVEPDIAVEGLLQTLA